MSAQKSAAVVPCPDTTAAATTASPIMRREHAPRQESEPELVGDLLPSVLLELAEQVREAEPVAAMRYRQLAMRYTNAEEEAAA